MVKDVNVYIVENCAGLNNTAEIEVNINSQLFEELVLGKWMLSHEKPWSILESIFF